MKWIENPPVCVLLANQFNPSIFTSNWLSKHGILDEQGTYKPESVFTSQLVQVVTEDFALVITQDQLQLMLLKPEEYSNPEQQSRMIEKILGVIICKLPEIPYVALGLNFNWHLQLKAEDIPAQSRMWFGKQSQGIFKRFDSSDAKFGAYLSKDIGRFRMKLSALPIIVSSLREERFQFSFNFHHDIAEIEGKPDLLASLIADWSSVRIEAIETIKLAAFRES
ncbi:MAG: hypothetical protein R3B84_17350 [Zavarzinella sp.]